MKYIVQLKMFMSDKYFNRLYNVKGEVGDT